MTCGGVPYRFVTARWRPWMSTEQNQWGLTTHSKACWGLGGGSIWLQKSINFFTTFWGERKASSCHSERRFEGVVVQDELVPVWALKEILTKGHLVLPVSRDIDGRNIDWMHDAFCGDTLTQPATTASKEKIYNSLFFLISSRGRQCKSQKNDVNQA